MPSLTQAEDARKTIADQLENASLSDEWLKHLHSSYVDRYKADNALIWSTTSFMVPLSLATFPAFLTLEKQTLEQAVAFGAVSSALMALWFVFAIAQRAYQTRSYDMVRAIERRVLGSTAYDEIRTAAVGHRGDPKLGPQGARLLLLVGTVLGWVALVVRSAT